MTVTITQWISIVYNVHVNVAVIICYKEDMMCNVSTLLYLSNLGRPVVEITQDNIVSIQGWRRVVNLKEGGGD